MTSYQDSFTQRLKVELERIETRLRLARSRIETEKVDARAELRLQLAELERRRDDLRSRLEALGTTAGEAWEEARRGTSKAWRHFKAAYDEFERGLARAWETVAG